MIIHNSVYTSVRRSSEMKIKRTTAGTKIAHRATLRVHSSKEVIAHTVGYIKLLLRVAGTVARLH